MPRTLPHAPAYAGRLRDADRARRRDRRARAASDRARTLDTRHGAAR